MKLWIACVLVLAACSFTGVESPRWVAPGRVECHADIGVPTVDALVAVGSLSALIALHARWQSEDGLDAYLDRDGMILLGTLGALSAAAALYGFHEVGRCERAQEALRARQLAASEQARARRAAREAAWQATKQAAAAARAGDCTTVARLDTDVHALDAVFHETVFVRDVAIAHCLGPRRGAR